MSLPPPDIASMPPTETQISELYERYAHVVFHRARNILGSDDLAQDAVQETFARVIVHWDQFRGESSPLTWMYRISTNWSLNQLRNRRGRQDKLDHRTHDVVGEGVSWQKPTLEAERVRALLADCDEQTRAIVIHLYFDDLTREQTASLVGLSVPTVRKRLRHFLKRANRQLTMDRRHALAAPAVFLLLSVTSWGLP